MTATMGKGPVTEEDMAIVIILAGSLLGFISGAAAYLFLGTGLLASLAIWIGAGPVSGLVALAVALGVPPSRRKPAALPRGKIA